MLKDRKLWKLTECKIHCCTGDKCNTKEVFLPYPGSDGVYYFDGSKLQNNFSCILICFISVHIRADPGIIPSIFVTMQIFSFFVGAMSIFCFALPSVLTPNRAFHFISSLFFASFWLKDFLIVNVRSFLGLSHLLSLCQLASVFSAISFQKLGSIPALLEKKAVQSLRVPNISLFYSPLTLLPYPST